jgi:hypothetical protein
LKMKGVGMNTTASPKRANNEPAAWEAVLSAIVSGLVLWGAWYFFGERLQSPDRAWYAWIRPIVLAVGGLLGLVAAALLAVRHPGGREVLKLAAATIPVFLAAGLIIVPFRFAGEVAQRLSGGIDFPTFSDLLDRVSNSPLLIGNLVIVALIILIALLGQLGKSGGSRHDGVEKR